MKWTVLLICLVFICVSCSKSPNMDDSPSAQTSRIDPACENPEACCQERCTGYCGDNGGKYEKHVVNGQTCACFCSKR